MYPLRIFAILFTVLLLAGKPAIAQDSHYLFSGYTYAGFESIDGDHSFVIGNFAPVFLYSHGDRFLIETELKIGYGHGGISTDLEYLNLGYFLNDYFTIRVGQFLSRFNTYNDRFHAAWINKMPNDPLGLGHHDLLALPSEFGVEVSGGAYLGGPKINYALFVSNGGAFEVNEDEPSATMNFHNFNNHNNSYAVGGRLGILPLDDSSLELGIAGHFNNKIGEPDTPYENVSSFSWSTDLSYLRQNISWLRGNVDLRAQMNTMLVDRIHLVFNESVQEIDMDQRAYYGQLAYRPTRSSSSLLKNLEWVLRYSVHNMPAAQFGGDDHDDEVIVDHDPHSNSTTDAIANKFSLNNTLQSTLLINDDSQNDDHNDTVDKRTQWGFGINYWFSWRTKVKFTYQINDFNGSSTDAFFIQFATGL